MTWWINAAQYATEALTIILIFRLLWLRDSKERVYSVFVIFLSFKLLEAVAYLSYSWWGSGKIDYRLFWIYSQSVLLLCSLWLVYSLAKALLGELPGILRFSRMLLNIVFPLAIVLAFSTVRSEYWATHGAAYHNAIDRFMLGFYVADRAIAMALVFVLIAILGFILWFPVKMSRNLAIFSVGLVIYFTAKTGLELLRTFSQADGPNTALLSVFCSIVLLLCFVYWVVFLDSKGKTAQVRMGHSWRLAEQQKLLQQLESINAVLLQQRSQHLEL